MPAAIRRTGPVLPFVVLVEGWGGKVWFENTLGQGTTFFYRATFNPVEE